MWPDVCSEELGDAQGYACDFIIPGECSVGDHRRCDTARCDVAARWHPAVRRLGVEAALAAGAIWAVVSIAEGRATLVGTGDHLGRAKSIVRTGHAKRHGIETGDPAAKGLVYVVRGSDGGFF